MIALDTNILVYAVDASPDPRHGMAAELMVEAVAEGWILPVQVMGEFLNVTSRKPRELHTLALDALVALQQGCQLIPTAPDNLITAFEVAQRHRLQYFDALILTVAGRAGATTLYSEDMQHGLTVGTLTVINPFR